jgi:hypothetical protein
MLRTILTVGLVVFLASPLCAQELPLVDDIPVERLRQQCRQLLAGLEKLGEPLPAATTAALRRLIETEPFDPTAVQKLLDPHCLAGIHINPESRVKVARGPAEAVLTLERPRCLLLKIHNDAGVTAPLGIEGPQLFAGNSADDPARWLHLVVVREPFFPKALRGETVEYVVVRLTARQAGKREATLRFDVGQGSQDLGFRAETPILFTVRRP